MELRSFTEAFAQLSNRDLTITFNDHASAPPVVNIITLPRTVFGGSTVFLDAAVSDPDDDIADLTIVWTATGGAGEFDDDSEPVTTWNSPVVTANQTITLTLTATDSTGNSDTASIDIVVLMEPPVAPDTVIAPSGPVVITPERTTITEGEDIQLIGSVMLQDDRAPQEFRVNESLNRLELFVESSLALRIQAFRNTTWAIFDQHGALIDLFEWDDSRYGTESYTSSAGRVRLTGYTVSLGPYLGQDITVAVYSGNPFV